MLDPFGRALRADLHAVRFLSHATSSRQAYDITYNCRSVLKHVLKCYDIFSDVHVNRKSCPGPVASLSHTTKIVPCKSALRTFVQMALRDKLHEILHSVTAPL